MIFFYIAIILLVRVNGFFIQCESHEDCEFLNKYAAHFCDDHICVEQQQTTTTVAQIHSTTTT